MPAALPVIYTRLQDMTDAPTLGAGQDGDALTWDNSAGAFVAASLFTESAADALYYALDDGNSLASSLSTHTGNASLHRVINDSSTASTVLWSANKINTELAAKGAGDFLADGSVPMTGDLDLDDNSVTSDDGDTTHLLGRAAIGYDGTNSDFAAFAHRDRMNANSFAFCQHSGGASFFNAATGTYMSFRINNSEVANIDASEFDLQGLAIVSTDGNTNHTLGRVYLGTAGVSDTATFAHRDFATSTDYGFRQNSAGLIVFNAPSAQAMHFRLGGSTTYMSLDSSGLDVADTPIASDDADTAFEFGRANVGDIGYSDNAGFSHRDFADTSGYALRQNQFGDTLVNAETGRSLYLRVGDSNAAIASSSGLTMYTGLILQSNTLTSADGDTVHTLGRAAIGYNGSSSDVAIFSHRDHATAAAAGFRQESDGDAIMNAPTGQTLQFKINNSDVVRVNSSGHLGIGTTTVDSNLHVEASTAAGSITTQTETVAVFEKNADTAIQFKMPNDSEARIYFSTPTAADNGYLSYDASVPQAHLRLGTTFGYTFGQSSFIHNTDNTASNGTGSFRWSVVYAATGTINTSDRREKRDIQPIGLGLDFINDLDPVSHRWKSSAYGKKSYSGLIAQDVAKVLEKHGIDPDDFAGYVDEGGILGLRYTEFIAPMIRAIQELSARVEALEAA